MRPYLTKRIAILIVLIGIVKPVIAADDEKHFLYVAVPGIRNYTEYGGEGILVFDIEDEHRFVKRIATRQRAADSKVDAVKGICANAATKRLYYSTMERLLCIDLMTEKIVWEKTYDSGCDR